ncbi:hypothetical protein [Salinisphaera sp.]|uniref:hypothetical protein n=1 Tax=Salinisphaera sp. TaxID=1914330 RepID=UPI0025D2049F|nr:hypothetical protein [Salinisphaera sp.]
MSVETVEGKAICAAIDSDPARISELLDDMLTGEIQELRRASELLQEMCNHHLRDKRPIQP